ncbi:hypothetical protein RhiirA5_443627 [Rhizophagus irregularis]|uniref:Uncharacterized protein n=2 Tax=Rhizophagus irregularis TaxID=588596 RepID=A0A2N0NDS4_9GLOM|nr:hypothetical protein RhiirA5_443627 [Rhizophagus irregularis]CAB5191506.1 unnamed protein product [Rhizophagus irregularis]
MLRTSQAQFYIGFINSRWFITTYLNDIKNRPLYFASKFNTNLKTSLLESNNFLEFLDVIDDVSSISISIPYVFFNKQRLYANVHRLVKQVNQISCKTCDESFIDLLKEYINKKNSEALTLEQSDNMENQDELEVDQENTHQNQIGNPIIRHPKRRLPGTARFKGPLENSSHSNEIIGGRTQNKCGLYYNVRYNRATCPSNPNKKKRRQN